MALTVFRPGFGFSDPFGSRAIDALGGSSVWAPQNDALGPIPPLGRGLLNPSLPDGYVAGSGFDAGRPFGPTDVLASTGMTALKTGVSEASGLGQFLRDSLGNGGGFDGAGFAGGAMSNLLVNSVLAHTGLEKTPGGQAGAAIGSLALTPFIGPLGPVAGAAIGSLFGNRPSVGPNATTGIDLTTFRPWGQSQDNGGSSARLDPFLGNQLADLASAVAGYGGTADLARIQYGMNPGNHGGPLNQFAVVDSAGNTHVLSMTGQDRYLPNGNAYDIDPHELIRQLVDAGLYVPADRQALEAALGPRKLLYSPEQLRQIQAQTALDQQTWQALLGGTGGA